jgi:hypothetical protein
VNERAVRGEESVELGGGLMTEYRLRTGAQGRCPEHGLPARGPVVQAMDPASHNHPAPGADVPRHRRRVSPKSMAC